MKDNCAVILDLLPLWADGVCSEESRRLIGEHLASCESCRTLADALTAEQEPPIDAPSDAETVLRKTSRRLSGRAIGSAVGVTLIVLYWLVYLWQDALSNAGDYRYFSYSFHEIYSAGYLLVPLATLIWLGTLLVRSLKGRAFRKNAALILLLVLLMTGQGNYLYQQSQKVQVTAWTTVTAIPDEYHIVIETDGIQRTLSTTPLVTNLLRTDGTVYGFYYERSKNDPTEGQLNFIWGEVGQ